MILEILVFFILGLICGYNLGCRESIRNFVGVIGKEIGQLKKEWNSRERSSKSKKMTKSEEKEEKAKLFWVPPIK